MKISPLVVFRMAYRTAGAEPGRVLFPALFIFGLDAVSTTFFTEVSVDHLGIESVAAVVVLTVSTLGLTFYSGLMERLVGAVERGDEAPPVFRVLRTLPYGRLLLADAILWALSSVASLAFVIPGLIVSTLFSLIGPLINMEDHSVRAAFRRSAQLVGPHFLLVLCMITAPLALEHELVNAIALLEPHEHIWLVYLTNLVMGMAFGVSLGLIEVSLAERLVHNARGPGNPVESPVPSGGPEAETEIGVGAGPEAGPKAGAEAGQEARQEAGPGAGAGAGPNSRPGVEAGPEPKAGPGAGERGDQGGHHGGDDSRDGHAGAGALPAAG